MTATPTWKRVAEDICRRITSGETPVGEQIPSQQQLAARYGASVGTIKRAVGHLSTTGLLEGAVGSGVYVQRLPRPADLEPALTVDQRLAALEQRVAQLEKRAGD